MKQPKFEPGQVKEKKVDLDRFGPGFGIEIEPARDEAEDAEFKAAISKHWRN